MNGLQPRIMVSSVVEGFRNEREAARNGIEDGGGVPILVNEDFPAMGTSPRNACLDAVDSSDAYLVILGARAGYRAPAGKPVVEEEYERAIARGLPVLAFVQEGVEREAEAQRLEKRISEYVGGHFRSSFANVEQLRGQVATAVREVVRQLANPIMDPTILQRTLESQAHAERGPILRTVFAPVRDEEIIDTVELGRDSFHEEVVGLATEKEVGLFSAWHAKEAQLLGDSLTIRQNPGNSPPLMYARVELSPNGLLVLESNVTDRQASERGNGISGLQILEGDVREVLDQHFSFAHRLYEFVDPFRRHHTISYNCALLGAAFRGLAQEPATGGPMRMSMRGDGPIIVHPQPREIGRAVLAAPQPEFDRVLELLGRRMRD